MSDIAKLAGVSASTVSRALADSPLIQQSVKDKIVALAKTHGFVANQAAVSFRLQRSRTISLVVPLAHEHGQMLNDPFMLEIIGRLVDEITRRDYEVLVKKIDAPGPGWLNEIVQSRRSDGVVVIGQSDQHEVLNAVAERYLPLVVWGGAVADRAYCTVGVDNVEGGRLAVEHLVGRGRRRIAFMGVPETPEVGLRRRGYEEAMSAAGLPILPELSVPAHFVVGEAYAAIRALIARKVPFDGVFASSDVIALAAIRAMNDAGVSVPGDVSVVGFDDIELARHSAPPLTTIRQNLEVGAHEIVDRLFRRIAGEAAPSLIMKAELVERAS